MVIFLSHSSQNLTPSLSEANEWSEPHVSGQVPENGVAAFGIAAHGHNIYIHGGMMEYCEYSNEMFMLNTHTWEWTHINITNKDIVSF